LTPFPLMYGQREEELPYEVILAIQRVLELHSGQETDPLDVLSDDFSPVDVLNIFFPDEASLAQIDVVQTRLAANQLDLQREIYLLQDELKRDQDPSKMQLIQEMISVCSASNTPSLRSSLTANYAFRICWGKCHAFAKRRRSLRRL